MKNTYTPMSSRRGLYRVWTETGNPQSPLACVWIDPDSAMFGSPRRRGSRRIELSRKAQTMKARLNALRVSSRSGSMYLRDPAACQRLRGRMGHSAVEAKRLQGVQEVCSDEARSLTQAESAGQRTEHQF